MKKSTLLIVVVIIFSLSYTLIINSTLAKDDGPQFLYGIYASNIQKRVIERVGNNPINKENLPEHARLLLEDDELHVGITLGTLDFDSHALIRESSTSFIHNGITITINLYDSKEGFKRSLTEDELSAYYGHSRYGMGAALQKDGLDKPFEMQADTLIIKKEFMYGYNPGDRIISDKGDYISFKGSTKDIDETSPYPGFQIIVMGSCSSNFHFLNEFQKFSKDKERIVILTTAPIKGFCQTTVVDLISGILSGEEISTTITKMNNSYKDICQSEEEEDEIKDNIFKLSINTIKDKK